MTGTVLEEGLRGAGGQLLDGDGRRFMFDYDDKGERATRDIVSRAIYDEMRKGNTSPNGGVYISMSHLGPEQVTKKFKGMVERCADCGFDLAAGRVEVVPTAHYFMGGVVVDADTRTEMPGPLCSRRRLGRRPRFQPPRRQWRCQLHRLWRHRRLQSWLRTRSALTFSVILTRRYLRLKSSAPASPSRKSPATSIPFAMN